MPQYDISIHPSGFYPSPLDHPWCSRILKAAHKHLHANKLKRQSLSVENMYKVLYYHFWGEGLEFLNLRTMMHLTVLLLAFLGLFRYSDMSHILVHQDLLRFIPCDDDKFRDDGVLIFLPHSKTDQEWSGNWVAIGATGGPFCPVMILRKLLRHGGYCTSHPTDDCGPLLRAITGHHSSAKGQHLAQVTSSNGRVIPPLSHTTLLKSARTLLVEAGVMMDFGLHSLRSGGASAAYLSDVPRTLLCQHGRWKAGATMEDHYLNTHQVQIQKFFEVTRSFWPY